MSVRYGDAIVAGSMLVDQTPTQGSNRPVSSGGVFDTCANRDASNFTTTGTTFLSAQSMPDITHKEELTILTTGSEYTAPASGWFCAQGIAGGVSQGILFATSDVSDINFGISVRGGSSGSDIFVIHPIRKDDKVVLRYSGSITSFKLFFVYAEGNPGGQ